MHTNVASEILRVLDRNLRDDPKFLITGLGVTDPKGVFGTTLGLVERYGDKRVLETPTSENAMTGVGVGLAIAGYRPLMIHQRLDFFILAMDQLVNSAAKWHYMFGGQNAVPMTILENALSLELFKESEVVFIEEAQFFPDLVSFATTAAPARRSSGDCRINTPAKMPFTPTSSSSHQTTTRWRARVIAT